MNTYSIENEYLKIEFLSKGEQLSLLERKRRIQNTFCPIRI